MNILVLHTGNSFPHYFQRDWEFENGILVHKTGGNGEDGKEDSHVRIAPALGYDQAYIYDYSTKTDTLTLSVKNSGNEVDMWACFLNAFHRFHNYSDINEGEWIISYTPVLVEMMRGGEGFAPMEIQVEFGFRPLPSQMESLRKLIESDLDYFTQTWINYGIPDSGAAILASAEVGEWQEEVNLVAEGSLLSFLERECSNVDVDEERGATTITMPMGYGIGIVLDERGIRRAFRELKDWKDLDKLNVLKGIFRSSMEERRLADYAKAVLLDVLACIGNSGRSWEFPWGWNIRPDTPATTSLLWRKVVVDCHAFELRQFCELLGRTIKLLTGEEVLWREKDGQSFSQKKA